MNIREISALLANRAEDIARMLLPQGKREGREWCAGSTHGESGKSLKVAVKGDKAGIWCDFATGETGDLLDLWCEARGLSLPQALTEARQYLGIRETSFQPANKPTFSRPAVKGKLPTGQTEVGAYLTGRGLTGDTIRTFKIREEPGLIVFPYWRDGELIFQKYEKLARVNGKKDTRPDRNMEPCLFGWDSIPATARQVTICEGEIDAMTLFQYGWPALSVPFGGGGGEKQRWVEFEYDRLERFETIYLCMDADEQGRAAAAELIQRLGVDRCLIVELPHKDANACLQAGVDKAGMDACFQGAKAMDPEELKDAAIYAEAVINEFYPPDGQHPGFDLPWSHMNPKLRFRPAELTVWTGINGHGKSQILGHVMLAAAAAGERICIASLELKPAKLLHRLTRQATAMNQPSPDYIRMVHDWYSGKFWVFDVTGTAKAERILDVFRYARKRYGIRQFVIDSLMKCGIAEDDYKAQKAFVEALTDFKNQFDCHVHLVAHARKKDDEKQAPGKLDVKGTGAITDLADTCLTAWRNRVKEEKLAKAKTDEEKAELLEAPDAILICDKQRNGDWEGKAALWFDPASLQFLERRSQPPRAYVPFTKLQVVSGHDEEHYY